MYRGNRVELCMKKMMHSQQKIDKNRMVCEVCRYDVKEECIYLMLKDGELTDVSLDAVYECLIDEENYKLSCNGIVRERYNSEIGKVLEFEIKNGFYKINVKSVDKQMA